MPARRRSALVSPSLFVAVAGLSTFVLTSFGFWLAVGYSEQKNAAQTPHPRLSYRHTHTNKSDTWTFTILQLADLHLGEAQDTDWGPEQDHKTWLALRSYFYSIGDEIDLVVLSGDQLTANDCYNRRNVTEYYVQLGQHLEQWNIPFACIFGNHDDKPGDRTGIATTTRRALVETLQRRFSDKSLTRVGPGNVTGISNYWLDVYQKEAGEDVLATRIVLMDSGGGSLPQTVDNSHLKWLVEEYSKTVSVPVVAFAHIPTNEFGFDGARCVGENGDQGFAPLDAGDTGLVDTLQSLGVHFLGVGHNHGNDYCCPFVASNNSTGSTVHGLDGVSHKRNKHRLHLCFGRHSGYGGYGSWERGARMYKLQLKRFVGEREDSFSWRSLVLLESGATQDEYIPL